MITSIFCLPYCAVTTFHPKQTLEKYLLNDCLKYFNFIRILSNLSCRTANNVLPM